MITLYDESTNLMIGRRFGPYRVQDVLGTGTVSVVYLALNSDDERIALKLLTPFAEARSDIRVSIAREFRIMSRLDHDAIVRARRGGSIADVSYIEMDWVDGPTLAERLNRKRLPAIEVAAIGARIAHALDHVHEHDAVHRDVKPSNILSGPDGPVLFDFGLALDLLDPDAIDGRVYGSPGYLSPEQALAGSGPPVEARSDLYGLGATLYHLVTGRPLFVGDRLDLLRGHVESTPDKPSRSCDLPPELERAILVALEKRPEDRFSSGAEMAAALAVVAETSPAPTARRRWLRSWRTGD